MSAWFFAVWALKFIHCSPLHLFNSIVFSTNSIVVHIRWKIIFRRCSLSSCLSGWIIQVQLCGTTGHIKKVKVEVPCRLLAHNDFRWNYWAIFSITGSSKIPWINNSMNQVLITVLKSNACVSSLSIIRSLIFEAEIMKAMVGLLYDYVSSPMLNTNYRSAVLFEFKLRKGLSISML